VTSNNSNLYNSHVEMDMRDLFSITFSLYNMAEGYKILYRKDPRSMIPKKLISLYFDKIKPNYARMIYSFKKKYVANEILLEKNDTIDQRRGLKDVYDFIQNYDVNNNFDILTCTLLINSLLWKYRDQKFVEDTKEREEEINKLFEEAKKEKNLAKYRQAEELRRNFNATSKQSKIGGRFRTKDEEVRLLGLDIKVPSSNEAIIFMNTFASKEKKDEFNKYLKDDVFEYINYCIRITTEMMRNQPFLDGNKRTFRSLLNLLFKIRNLPPVYIKTNERTVYKNALYKAMKNNDYGELYNFYYFKICDSIYELDILPYQSKKDSSIIKM